MADRKGFNGLRQIGGNMNVPMIGQNRPVTVEQAIEQEINSLARALFLQVAPPLIQRAERQDEESIEVPDYEGLGAHCKEAAAGFMLGVGIIERKPSEADQPAT